MIPISDENPTFRFPVVTVALLAALGAAWVLLQGAGFSTAALARSTCNLGLVPGEITGRAEIGTAIPLGRGLVCAVDDDAINFWTPLISMFLHGGWGHLLGNALFLWVFGNNVEDSMGRARFLAFYLLCGLGAAAAQVAVSPESPVPMIGASGAIAGVLGAYLILYPRVQVNVLMILVFFIQVIRVPAYLMLLFWIGWQFVGGLPQLNAVDVRGGTAFWAHIGGFAAGVVLVKFFENKALVREHHLVRRKLHPGHW